MMKATRKLLLRRDTLRVLAEVDLARVAGGTPNAQIVGTGGPNQSCQVAAQPHRIDSTDICPVVETGQ